MSDLLAAAADALGVPEAIVSRSAAARATATGATVDEVLAAWAEGGDIQPAAAEPAPPEDTEKEEEAPGQPAPETPDEPTTETPQPSATGDEEPAAPPTRPTPVPAPSVSGDVVITVATAGIKERTAFTVPRWLVALFVVIPTFGLLHLAGATAGEECGSATRLLADRLTGAVVDCDGSTFEGGGAGGGATDFVALGDRIYNGSGVTGVNCAGCHGAGGAGSAAFPALTGVGTTFGACADHVEWVMLGSTGFQAAGRGTYGDTAKPIRGGMPPHPALTEEQLAAVASFERIRFGGGDRDLVLSDCGLTEPVDDEAPGEEEMTEEPTTASG